HANLIWTRSRYQAHLPKSTSPDHVMGLTNSRSRSNSGRFSHRGRPISSKWNLFARQLLQTKSSLSTVLVASFFLKLFCTPATSAVSDTFWTPSKHI